LEKELADITTLITANISCKETFLFEHG
jgi:hypothetical protein